MKNLTLVFLLFVFSLALVACKSRQPAEPVTIETERIITNTIRDTVFTKEADSSSYYALIDCVNGKPVITQPPAMAAQSKAGRKLEVPKVKLEDNKLQVDCHQEAEDLFFKWKETYSQEKKVVTVPRYIEKPFKWYHKTLMWIGGIFLALSAIGLTIKFAKP